MIADSSQEAKLLQETSYYNGITDIHYYKKKYFSRTYYKTLCFHTHTLASQKFSFNIFLQSAPPSHKRCRTPSFYEQNRGDATETKLLLP
jgi:hypothetical protein